jgi:hypothetical protein
MSKPPSLPFSVLRSNFPAKARVKPQELYESIGHPEKLAIAGWDNTCAVRMSLALVRSGIAISPGYLTINADKNKGARIESRQKRLSEFLARKWGAPEKYAGGAAAKKGIGKRRGVISFFQLLGPTDQQGHIDLVSPDDWTELACANDCYWGSVEVWFWPMK